MPQQSRSFNIGVCWSLLSAVVWSTTFVGARYLVANGQVDPITLSALRFLIGGLLLAVVGVIRYRRSFFALTVKELGWLALLALFGIVGMSVLIFYGLQSTSAINSSIIIELSPVMTILLGLLIGERITLGKAGGSALALAGCAIVVGIVTLQGIHFETGHLLGDLLVLASGLCWAINTVMGKKIIARLGGLRTTVWTMAFGTLELFLLQALLPVLARWGLLKPIAYAWPHSPRAWSILLFLAIFPTAIGFFAWFEAMRRIPLSLLNVMQYLSPPCTILLAWILLGERMPPVAWLGALLTLLGVMWVGRE